MFRVHILFILLLQHVHGSADIKWYRKEMSTKVIPRYQTAYRMLNDDIIQPILNFDENFDTMKVTTDTTVEMITDTTIEVKEYTQATMTFKNENINEQTTQSTLLDDEEVEDHSEDRIVVLKAGTGKTKHSKHSKINKGKSLYEQIDVSGNIIQTENEDLDDIVAMINGKTTTTATINFGQKPNEKPEDGLTQLVNKIQTAAKGVYANLKYAASECERLRIKLNKAVISAVITVSKQEERCRKMNITINEIISDIQIQEKGVTFAEQVVQERQESAKRAEKEAHKAGDRVEKARRCRSKRRKKRAVESSKGVQNTLAENSNIYFERSNINVPQTSLFDKIVVKPVCSIINMGGIKAAENAESQAKAMLVEAKRRLTTARHKLARRRRELEDERESRDTAEKRRETLNLQLSKLQSNYSMISSFSEKLLNITTHITTVLGTSKQLHVEIKRLLDFELVIEPLNSLTRSMVKDELMPAFGFEISLITITNIGDILNRLANRLESFPLLVNNNQFMLTD